MTQDPDFWHAKWEADQIGFHQSTIHPSLEKHAPRYLPAGDVFVPLCGKTKDMTYLNDQDHKVIGIDLSPIAVRDFFAENNMSPTHTHAGELEQSTSGDFTLYAGDFFTLKASHMKNVKSVYDRAALIALTPDLRRQYAQHLRDILPKGTHILLIALEYDQSQMDGPPHRVDATEIQDLFGSWCQIEKIETSEPEKFRGILAHETVTHLVVNAA
jgi:thiopurine S-methyltransferase